jgi:GNAT superfamily N-acetyltransferase
MGPISIRLADLASLDATVALLQAQLWEHEIVTSETDLREVAQRVIADPRHGFIALAFHEQDAVGVAYAAAHLSAEQGGTIGWLEELFVRAEWRGCGVGAALLQHVIARAQTLDWRTLELEVVEGHERASALYERLGFRAMSRTRFSRRTA